MEGTVSGLLAHSEKEISFILAFAWPCGYLANGRVEAHFHGTHNATGMAMSPVALVRLECSVLVFRRVL